MASSRKTKRSPVVAPVKGGTQRVLCWACDKPIHIDDFAGITKTKDGKDALFHKQLPCLIAFYDAASSGQVELVRANTKLKRKLGK